MAGFSRCSSGIKELLNVFSARLDEGLECAHGTFTGDTKLGEQSMLWGLELVFRNWQKHHEVQQNQLG